MRKRPLLQKVFIVCQISTAFYPLNVVRTHMMIVVGGPFVSVFKVFSSLFMERGIRGMFKGVHANYTRYQLH
jgi:hypothetical protein